MKNIRMSVLCEKYKGINETKLNKFLQDNNITEYILEIKKFDYTRERSEYRLTFVFNNELFIYLMDSAWSRIYLESLTYDFINLNIITPKKIETNKQESLIFYEKNSL